VRLSKDSDFDLSRALSATSGGRTRSVCLPLFDRIRAVRTFVATIKMSLWKYGTLKAIFEQT
jgi:hypothetical protein